MKFLVGVIVGGLITVIAAERFAANVSDRESSTAGALLTWIETAAGRLKHGWAEREDQLVLAHTQPEPDLGAGVETDAAVAEAPGDPLAANMQAPMAQLAGPDPLPPADGPETPLLAGSPEHEAELAVAELAETIQPVWAPFRSQTSAEGFARRLSDETQHPFGIDRRGPGRYQVFFAYADEDERRLLLDRVRPLIGSAAP